ncbi:hypothetical protein [Caenibius sp. WL]|uniref:hypothetical protein n=1 Tax=Caenibius sp. WL TaxID=2872646 RepID=UPI001C990B76|nr:hypothetical protein [Caenibius sp. WL]QZP06834.1 hypothetical protein K5X80_08840 [Caenibius sp. WL]
MTGRKSIIYGETEVRPVHVPGAVDVTTPVAGYYRYRLRAGAVKGGVKLWYGPPLDPVTGEELDRSWRWQAQFEGEYVDFDRVWPACAGDPITPAEYDQYISRKRWAEKHAPGSAYANRAKRIDLLSPDEPLPF